MVGKLTVGARGRPATRGERAPKAQLEGLGRREGRLQVDFLRSWDRAEPRKETLPRLPSDKESGGPCSKEVPGKHATGLKGSPEKLEPQDTRTGPRQRRGAWRSTDGPAGGRAGPASGEARRREGRRGDQGKPRLEPWGREERITRSASGYEI